MKKLNVEFYYEDYSSEGTGLFVDTGDFIESRECITDQMNLAEVTQVLAETSREIKERLKNGRGCTGVIGICEYNGLVLKSSSND